MIKVRSKKGLRKAGNDQFHLHYHLKLSEKTWFRILKKPVVISCMFGNEGILSAKSFGLGSNSFGKSFMNIRNNKGTKTDPYVTLTLVFVYEDNLSFKAALY